MCGIFGYIAQGTVSQQVGSKSKYQYDNRVEDAFVQGLLTIIPRGFDAAGIFTVPRFDGDKVDCYKRAVNVTDFFQLNKTKKMLYNINDHRAVVGHVRASTRGSDTDDNAHPHWIGNTIMVHNGTLSNHNDLVPSAPSYASDSAALCNAINELGPEAAFAKAEGSYAVVMYNTDTGTFQFIRNDDRPFHFAYVDDPKILIFSSEKKHLEWIMERNKLVAANATFYTANPDVLITVDPTNVHNITGVKITKEKKHIGFLPPGNTKSSKKNKNPKARDTDSDEIMAALGLQKGDYIEFWPYQFDKYTRSTLGTVRGTVADDGFDQVIAYGTPWDTVHVADGEMVTTMLNGKLIHAKYENINGVAVPLLVLTDVIEADAREEIEEEEEIDSDFNDNAYIAGPDGDLLTLSDFLNVAKSNCSACGGKIFAADVTEAGWLHKAFCNGTTGLLCPICTEQLSKRLDGTEIVSHMCVTN